MKKPLTAILISTISFLINGCDVSSLQSKNSPEIDSLMKATDKQIALQRKLTSDSLDKIAPIKIVKAYITHNSIGNPEANVVVKNVSNVPIDGYKIQFLCCNNFGDTLGITEGENQDLIRERIAKTETWTLYNYENTTKIRCRVYQVHFKNDSLWKNLSENMY